MGRKREAHCRRARLRAGLGSTMQQLDLTVVVHDLHGRSRGHGDLEPSALDEDRRRRQEGIDVRTGLRGCHPRVTDGRIPVEQQVCGRQAVIWADPCVGISLIVVGPAEALQLRRRVEHPFVADRRLEGALGERKDRRRGNEDGRSAPLPGARTPPTEAKGHHRNGHGREDGKSTILDIALQGAGLVAQDRRCPLHRERRIQ